MDADPSLAVGSPDPLDFHDADDERSNEERQGCYLEGGGKLATPEVHCRPRQLGPIRL
jgi:hypothetical protein